MHKLALSIVLTSQGISFLHAGTEFLRSKKGIENSYNQPDSINAIDKKHLKASELKMLRKELRGIRGELKELDGGNYVPVKSLIMLLLVPLVVYNLTE